MSSRYPPVRLYREFDGERYLTIRDSVNISFYARASHQDIRHAVIRALDAYRRAIGHQRLAWYVDQHGEWQELDDSGWSFIRENVLDPESSPECRSGCLRSSSRNTARLGCASSRWSWERSCHSTPAMRACASKALSISSVSREPYARSALTTLEWSSQT